MGHQKEAITSHSFPREIDFDILRRVILQKDRFVPSLLQHSPGIREVRVSKAGGLPDPGLERNLASVGERCRLTP